MKLYCFYLFITVVLYGLWSIGQLKYTRQEEPGLYLVFGSQEACLEGIIRSLYRYLQRQCIDLKLILLIEESADQTLAIGQRLAQSLSFEVIPVIGLAEWIGSNPDFEIGARLLLDLRGSNPGAEEAYRIRQYIVALQKKTS